VSTGLDVGSLDEVAYEELYLRAVEREKPERRFELACRLSEMHAFLREAYLLEDLDWSAIMAAAGGVAQPGFADANLVTSAEYRRALAVITAEATLGDRRRWQYAGLLIFGFRFGLRFGEALRLAYTDVQRDGECVYVWVHNAMYGEVKSPAGVRVLLLTERLDPLEQQVLDRLLAAGEADFSENPGAMLMADRSGSQDLLDRAEAGRLLNDLLRRVTGDRRTRFHHLRHGWVTRAVAAQAVLPIPGFSEHLSDKAESELFGDAAGFPLRSIAVAAGHASERTTLGSYTHCVDQLATLYRTVPQLSDHAKAYAEQVASATIRTRRRTTRRSSEGRLPPIPEPAISTQLPQDVTIADLLGSLPDMRRPRLIDVDMLLRRFRSSGQSIEVVAESLGLDRPTSRRILRKAEDVELRTGYDGYRLAQRSDDPLALASSSQQVDQYRRETDALSIRLMEIQKRFSVMTASEQTVLVDALAVWVETANAAQWTCDVMQGEQLRAITDLARFMGAEIVATLSKKTDTEAVHILLRRYSISWVVRSSSNFSGIGLKLSNLEGPNRTLWRELLVMAATLELDN
jgi:integrase